MFFRTDREGQVLLREVSTWIAASVIGVGVALEISIVFMPLGLFFIAGGSVLAVIGWLGSMIAPRFFRYKGMRCPYCSACNKVRLKALDYECSRCTRRVVVNM